MKLDDILAKKEVDLAQRDIEDFFLEGSVEPDPDGKFFRVYPDAIDRSTYYRIAKDSVAGEIYEWNPEELKHSGFVGQSRYRVPLAFDAMLQEVAITYLRASDVGPSASCDSEGTCETKRCRNKDCRICKSGRWKCSSCCIA